MAFPDARLSPLGEIVDIETDLPLPNYTGTVLANLQGHIYVLWRFADGSWEVVNPGGQIVETALDKFLKEHTV